ncbi:hypothetical protein [Nocardioides sp. B-3]|uniref:hypothetical protein n=1 Tax=Nocardioides sp. B-3 TaxID=2895565 RepID=UPI00215272E0|nr:hypothetical protein [Nocardioides sp. B-3]UUZ60870.1 hypothetical protein LP418_09155 [Nocardioides sp. B-3]
MIRSLALALCAALVVTGCSQPAEVADDRLPDITLAGFDGGEPVDGRAPRPGRHLAVGLPGARRVARRCRSSRSSMRRTAIAWPCSASTSRDHQLEDARALVKKSGVTYPLVQDEAGDINGQGAFPLMRGLPYLAFVAEDGTVTHVEAVVIETSDELVEMVDEHLGVQL